MRRYLLRHVAPLLVWAATAPTAYGQAPAGPESTGPNLPLANFMAVILVIIVMVIVCMPSRKRQRTERGDL